MVMGPVCPSSPGLCSCVCSSWLILLMMINKCFYLQTIRYWGYSNQLSPVAINYYIHMEWLRWGINKGYMLKIKIPWIWHSARVTSARGSKEALRLWLLWFSAIGTLKLPVMKLPINLKGVLICFLISRATAISDKRHIRFHAKMIPRITWVSLFCFFTFLISSITSSLLTCPPILSLPWGSLSEFVSSVGKLFSQSFRSLSPFNECNCKKETQDLVKWGVLYSLGPGCGMGDPSSLYDCITSSNSPTVLLLVIVRWI